MKRILSVVLVACLALSAMAKDMPKQGLGFQIGWAQPILRLNSPTSIPKDSLDNVTKLNGFKVGVVYDGSIIAGFGTTIGLNYTFAANKENWKATGIIGEYPRARSFITYHEAELFVDWQYKFEVAKETYLMLYTGPSIQCGIAFNYRKDKQTNMDGEITSDTSNRYKTDNADEVLKRLNITWGLGAGFQYQRYFLRGGYDFGLIPPYKNYDFTNGNHARGRLDQWSVKIGMYLWYK